MSHLISATEDREDTLRLFGGGAEGYARYRPGYPDRLYATLAELAPRHHAVWDCGTGTGQAVAGLAKIFTQVIATDSDPDQVARAARMPGVRFMACAAESCCLANRSVDLVTVAQALHWFGHEAFFAEVLRVLRPGGVFVGWTYQLLRIAPEIDELIDRFYTHTIGRYWPARRRHVDEGYRNIPHPLTPLAVDPGQIEMAWTLPQLMGYLGTWSAVDRYRRQHGVDPLPALEAELHPRWGDPESARLVVWPLAAVAGRRP